MSGKALIAGLALLLSISVYLYYRAPPGADASASGPLLFPELEQQLNTITRIRISREGNRYELERRAGKWLLPGNGNYPASHARVKPVLLDLARLTVVEAKTEHAEQYARLGVQTPAPGSDNTRIDLFSAQRTRVAALIVGRVRPGLIAGGRDGIYAREPDQARAWLLAGNLDVPQRPVDWAERRIIHITPKQVRRVTITHPDGTRLQVEKAYRGAPDYKLIATTSGDPALPPGGALNLLARGLAALDLEDVMPRTADRWNPKDAVQADYETWDGIRIKVYTLERQGHIFAWFDIDNDATGLGTRLDGWIFRLSRNRGEPLRARPGDLTLPAS